MRVWDIWARVFKGELVRIGQTDLARTGDVSSNWVCVCQQV